MQELLAVRPTHWTQNHQLSDTVADLVTAAREAEGAEALAHMAGGAGGPRPVADIQRDIQDTVDLLAVRPISMGRSLEEVVVPLLPPSRWLPSPALCCPYPQVESLAEHRKAKLQGEENSYRLELEVWPG